MCNRLHNGILVLLLVLVPLLSTPAVAGANTIYAVAMPAPAGYIITIGHSGPDTVTRLGYDGHYKRYMAAVYETGAVYALKVPDSLVGREGVIYKVKAEIIGGFEPVLINGTDGAYILNPYGYKIYMSTRPVLFGPPVRPGAIVFDAQTINTSIGATYIVFAGDGWDTKLEVDGKQTTLGDYLGVPRACILTHTYTNGTVAGGFYDSVPCFEKTRLFVLASPEHKATVLGARVYDVIGFLDNSSRVIVVFHRASIDWLVRLGYFHPSEYSTAYHVLPASPYYHYYYLTARGVRTLKTVINASLASQPGTCEIPGGYKLVYSIAWRDPFTINQRLLPGELLVWTDGKHYYYCRGDMNFYYTAPTVENEKIYRHLTGGLKVEASHPVVLVLGNGRVYSGTTVEVPDYELEGNTPVLIAGSTPSILHVQVLSPFRNAGFLVFLTVVVVSIVAVPLSVKEKSLPQYIRIDLDRLRVEPLRTTDKYRLLKKSEILLEKKGYCPTLEELIRSGALPERRILEKTDFDQYYCKYEFRNRKEEETEKTLRELVELLREGFFTFRRLGKNKGIAYTLHGSLAIVYGVYIDHECSDPAELIQRAVQENYTVTMAYHQELAGIIIVSCSENRDALELAREKYASEQYTSTRVITVTRLDNRKKQELIEAIVEDITRIIRPLQYKTTGKGEEA